MVNEKMATDLLQYFTRANATLTEILRQAKESPIIPQAHSIRHCGTYAPDTDDFRVVNIEKIADADLLAADAIITWKRDTRDQVNDLVRALRGIEGHPKAGEPMMCIKNCPLHGVYNGIIYPLAEDYDLECDTDITIINHHGHRVTVPGVAYVPDQGELPKERKTGFWLATR
jgi:hypothetical protein